MHSQPGVGSTFTVHLEAPVCHSDESRARMAVRYNTQPSSPTQQQLGSMALVVEDNLINQMLVVMLLKTMGYDRVTTAENGQQAIELAQTMRFDVILMDSQMPVMDGNVATHTIRQQLGPNRHTRIIAITANVQPEDEIAARSVGIDAFVTKPINADKLREALNCFPRAPKLPSEDVDADQKQ